LAKSLRKTVPGHNCHPPEPSGFHSLFVERLQLFDDVDRLRSAGQHRLVQWRRRRVLAHSLPKGNRQTNPRQAHQNEGNPLDHKAFLFS